MGAAGQGAKPLYKAVHDRDRGAPGRAPAREYQFIVIATPAGNYFNKACVDIWVTEHFARAAMGGTGAAKCGGITPQG